MIKRITPKACERCGEQNPEEVHTCTPQAIPEGQADDYYFPQPFEINQASVLQLARWYRFLRSPSSDYERRCMDLIIERLEKKDRINPFISKLIEL